MTPFHNYEIGVITGILGFEAVKYLGAWAWAYAKAYALAEIAKLPKLPTPPAV